MSTFHRVCDADSLNDGGMRTVDVNGKHILVIRSGDNFYALKDECTHEEYPLSEGWVEDDCIHCAFHGAKFKLATGEALALPAYEDVKIYPVRVVDGVIEILIE